MRYVYYVHDGYQATTAWVERHSAAALWIGVAVAVLAFIAGRKV